MKLDIYVGLEQEGKNGIKWIKSNVVLRIVWNCVDGIENKKKENVSLRNKSKFSTPKILRWYWDWNEWNLIPNCLYIVNRSQSTLWYFIVNMLFSHFDIFPSSCLHQEPHKCIVSFWTEKDVLLFLNCWKWCDIFSPWTNLLVNTIETLFTLHIYPFTIIQNQFIKTTTSRILGPQKLQTWYIESFYSK